MLVVWWVTRLSDELPRIMSVRQQSWMKVWQGHSALIVRQLIKSEGDQSFEVYVPYLPYVPASLQPVPAKES